VNHQFCLSEKLERAVPFRVNGVSKAAVDCRKHGDDRTYFMVVGCVIDFLANRKLRHRKLLLESSVRLYLHKLVDRFNYLASGISDAVVVTMSQSFIPGRAVP
jgi:hypothetical protein